jgi:hypothetical protein
MSVIVDDVKGWRLTAADQFWSSVVPGEHILQIYEGREELLQMLAGFIGSGINSGDSIILIATPDHLDGVEAILKRHGIHIDSLLKNGRYFRLDAQATLARFMVDGWPDEQKFMEVMNDMYLRVNSHGTKKIRAFGEMVALLWGQGMPAATLELEKLWNKFMDSNELSLFCAYPHECFEGHTHGSIAHVCGSHAKLITGSSKPMKEIFYKTLVA